MGSSDRLLAVGVDGARGGWVAALGFGEPPGAGRVALRLVTAFAELAELRPEDAPVAVDVPMGLCDSVALRKCDRQARALLGDRRATVFAPPSRPLLHAGTYAQARALVELERTSNPEARSLSAQAFGIVAKVREADAYLQGHPDAREWLWECHPELSFRALAGGRDLGDKKSVRGQAERLALVSERFPGALDALRGLPAGRREAELADALDALAALHTALRVRAGQHEELGGETDLTGLLMRMVI